MECPVRCHFWWIYRKFDRDPMTEFLEGVSCLTRLGSVLITCNFWQNSNMLRELQYHYPQIQEDKWWSWVGARRSVNLILWYCSWTAMTKMCQDQIVVPYFHDHLPASCFVFRDNNHWYHSARAIKEYLKHLMLQSLFNSWQVFLVLIQ